MANFDWQDPFLLREQLTEEERLIQDSAAAFASTELQPRVTEDYRLERDNRDLFTAMGKQGLLGASIPHTACAGASAVSYGLITREIERVDSGYRSMLSVQSSLVMLPIFLFAEEPLRELLLPELACGRLIGAFGLTEPDHGSDPAGMICHWHKDGDQYVVTGNKSWISNSPIADVFVVWANNKDEGLRGFVLERGMAGLATPKISGKLSLRTSITGEIVMDKVRVPKSHLLAVKGFKGPFTCLNSARYGIAWGALGAAEACWLAARQYTLDRTQFDKPLAANQLIQLKLADMQTQISLGLQGCLRAGRLKQAEKLAPELISLLKRNNVGQALSIARTARDMHGANGVSDEYPVMRHACNLEAVNTYEGTADIHALILGRAQTGLSAF